MGSRRVTDTGVATPIGSATFAPISTTLTQAAAAATYPTKLLAREQASVEPKRVVTLVSAQVDETVPSLVSCTRAVDTVLFKHGTQSQKITMAGAVTAQVIYDWPSTPVIFPSAAQVCEWVYVTDKTKVTSITTELYCDAPAGSGHVLWSQTWTSASLVNGWNLLRYQATAGTLVNWEAAYRVRFMVVTSAATDVNIGHIWLDCPPKAQVMFIEDRGYRSFVDSGLADLRTLGIPVTWALDPTLHGTSVGTVSEVITDADVAEFAALGDSISVHGYDGTVTSTKTADQIVTDSLKAKRWCQQRGYTGHIWRAAWVQNDAPQHAAAQPYFLAYATPTSSAALTCWPPTNRWNIPRLSLHGLTTAAVDAYFVQLEKTHQLMVVYTHGIDAAGGTNATPAQWANFIARMTEGIEAGWLEAVTFEQLYARSGGKFRQGFADTFAEYVDETGVVVEKRGVL